VDGSRLWIPEESKIKDPQAYVSDLVKTRGAKTPCFLTQPKKRQPWVVETYVVASLSQKIFQLHVFSKIPLTTRSNIQVLETHETQVVCGRVSQNDRCLASSRDLAQRFFVFDFENTLLSEKCQETCDCHRITSFDSGSGVRFSFFHLLSSYSH
jgi:hypothetical protein